MNVPFIDLKAQYRSIQDEVQEAMQDVLDSTAFAGGPFVARFEEEFAEYCGCAHAIGVSSGTSALWLSLLAMGIGPGDEVITIPHTFVATVEAIRFCGAVPVFVDVNDSTYTIDPDQLEAVITSRTKAIIPVHLYGQMADMDRILAVAKEHELLIIEDACQAHGADYRGARAGSLGDTGAFSFYPGKNLGAYGEAGAVVTNNADLAERIRMIRDHGQSRKYYHDLLGWNARMDGIQGAILSVKLKYLDEWNDKRRACITLYNERLGDLNGLVTPFEADYGKHVYHLYTLCTSQRDALMKTLASHDIHCGIHYPVPAHLQEAFLDLGYGEGSFPVSEELARETLSLPLYAELSEEQIDFVCAAIGAEFFKTKPNRVQMAAAG